MASGSGPPQAGRQLPTRATRGKRMAAAMDDEEAQADEQFWNQEFFAEEAQDIDYERSESEEDVPDSDFDEPESEEDDEDVEEVDERPKRKALKAPEPKGPPRARAAPKKPAKKVEDDEDEEEYDMDDEDEDLVESEDDEEGGRPSKPQLTAEERARIRRDERKARELAAQESYAAPSLRRSTQVKSAEAKQEREWRNEMTAYRRPAKRSKSSKTQTLSQAELLAEAARTEIENIQSLKHLLAMEEATKKKAMIVKQKYMGPTVRLISKKRMLLAGSPAALQAAAARKAALEARAALEAAAPKLAEQQEPAAATAAAAPVGEAKPEQKQQEGQEKPGMWTAEDKPQPQGVDVEMPDASASQHLPAGSEGVRENGSQAGKEGGPIQQDARQEEGGAAGDKEGQQSGAAEGEEGAPGPSGQQDDNEYEATLYYEIAYMQYPPIWLRRFRALPPPAKATCAATGQPAKYKDPRSGAPFASAAAYRQIKGLPQPPARQQPQQQQQSIPLSISGLKELRAQQGAAQGTTGAGEESIARVGTCLLATPPSSSTLSARAKAAYASLPPPMPDLPPQSAVVPPLPPQGIPFDMMCLLVDFQRGMAGSSTGAGVSTRSTFIPSY